VNPSMGARLPAVQAGNGPEDPYLPSAVPTNSSGN